MRMRLLWSWLVLLAVLGQAPPSLAAEPGLAMQIDLAGRQRLFSQRVAASACFLSLGVDAEDQRRILTETSALFSVSLAALAEGHPAYGIVGAKDPTTREALTDARAEA